MVFKQITNLTFSIQRQSESWRLNSTEKLNQTDPPIHPEMKGGNVGKTLTHNLEQFFKSKFKTLTKYADGNLKIIFENFLFTIR